MRCGSGLFVTDDLLRPGAMEGIKLVGLHSSMAGLAMKEGVPVSVDTQPST